MAGNPYVREVGSVRDINDVPVAIGVDYDAVTICGHYLSRTECEEFARAFVAAVWEASDNARLMAEEASD